MYKSRAYKELNLQFVFPLEKKSKQVSKKQQEMAEVATKALRYLKTKMGEQDDDLMQFHFNAKNEDKTPAVLLKVGRTNFVPAHTLQNVC